MCLRALLGKAEGRIRFPGNSPMDPILLHATDPVAERGVATCQISDRVMGSSSRPADGKYSI